MCIFDCKGKEGGEGAETPSVCVVAIVSGTTTTVRTSDKQLVSPTARASAAQTLEPTPQCLYGVDSGLVVNHVWVFHGQSPIGTHPSGVKWSVS